MYFLSDDLVRVSVNTLIIIGVENVNWDFQIWS